MKAIFVLFVLFPVIISAQKPGTDNGIHFSLECFKPNTPEGPVFVLSITNNRFQDVRIPKKFIIGPSWAHVCDIVYEVFYCTPADTVNIFEGVVGNIDPLPSMEQMNLGTDETHLFLANIDRPELEKKGVYKIRFVLKKKGWIKFISKDIYTEWVYITM